MYIACNNRRGQICISTIKMIHFISWQWNNMWVFVEIANIYTCHWAVNTQIFNKITQFYLAYIMFTMYTRNRSTLNLCLMFSFLRSVKIKYVLYRQRGGCYWHGLCLITLLCRRTYSKILFHVFSLTLQITSIHYWKFIFIMRKFHLLFFVIWSVIYFFIFLLSGVLEHEVNWEKESQLSSECV